MPVEHVMGMPVRVEGCVDGARAFAWLRWVDATFSPYRADSEISRLGRGERFVPHPLVRSVLERCEALRLQTGGLFDVRAGGRLDPSGYVKGWAVQRAAAFGRGRFLIEAGGDMVLRGRWRVGIRHPYERDRLAASLALADCAVATSGLYERGPHIIDPRTGRPARGLSSVTIVGADLGTVDAYATAAFVAGDPLWSSSLAAMTIAGNRVFTTATWPRGRTRPARSASRRPSAGTPAGRS